MICHRRKPSKKLKEEHEDRLKDGIHSEVRIRAVKGEGRGVPASEVLWTMIPRGGML